MRVDAMKDFVTFYNNNNESPYPGIGGKDKVFESWGEIYEPSTKDVQLNSLETSTVNVTLIIRNAFPEYVPKEYHTFIVETGMYQGTEFNIKNVAPKDETTIKIVGSKIWA
ncbi:hypothetical protein BUY98_08845 [Staphylococcus gallinarum]|uniref:hypothetical protein n=1 Tax=Staphylococcus gallinarum TaxID=1293 RepID=UPI000E689FA5|nr:hypothetical protein [Staphylococcus gallinarum]RIL33028.1 hypothetical protein BUY98_08845 [Staphylococcus gallinarum]